MNRLLLVGLLLLGLIGCEAKNDKLLGTLEWDSISLPAEASEIILSVNVTEGDRVEAGGVQRRPG